MGSTNDGTKPRFYCQKQLGLMGTICWKTQTADKIKNIQNQILMEEDKWIVLEVVCNKRVFENKVKSTSDFYRKLSNGKSSFGSIPNRVFWSNTVNGGFYSSTVEEDTVTILMCLNIKKTTSFGLTLQLMSRVKKILPFCTIEVGNFDSLKIKLSTDGITNKIQFVGHYYYPLNYQNSVG